MSDNIRSVLFVCTGNSCRSVMAEALLKKALNGMGKTHITVRSAGIASFEGLSPTLETIEVLKKEGIDVSASRSKRIAADMLRDSDLILVMEELHREEIMRVAPWAAPKVHLLKEYGLDEKRPHNPGIADPIGRPKKEYEACFQSIKKEIERIAKII